MTQTALRDVLRKLADYAADYRASVPDRPHRPDSNYADTIARFTAPTPESGAPLDQVISELIALSEPGLAAMVGPRFFGWVIGGTEPVGVAADWLASTWGQNTGNGVASPSSCAAEEVAGGWLLDLLDLPRESSIGFVTGATMANFTCLAAARGEVLRRGIISPLHSGQW